MSIKNDFNSLITGKVTGVSFTNALDLPDGRISLLRIVSSSKSKSWFVKNSSRLYLLMVNLASTIHFSLLFFNEDVSARLPSTKPKAPKIIDLPAPVSPVNMVNPFDRSIVNS